MHPNIASIKPRITHQLHRHRQRAARQWSLASSQVLLPSGEPLLRRGLNEQEHERELEGLEVQHEVPEDGRAAAAEFRPAQLADAVDHEDGLHLLAQDPAGKRSVWTLVIPTDCGVTVLLLRCYCILCVVAPLAIRHTGLPRRQELTKATGTRSTEACPCRWSRPMIVP